MIIYRFQFCITALAFVMSPSCHARNTIQSKSKCCQIEELHRNCIRKHLKIARAFDLSISDGIIGLQNLIVLYNAKNDQCSARQLTNRIAENLKKSKEDNKCVPNQ